MVGPSERDLHVVRDRPGDKQHIGETRRCGEMYAEPLAVVNRIVHSVDLQLAPVARTRIHLPDREAPLKTPSDDLLQLNADTLDLRIGYRRQFLGHDAGAEYLFENSDHKIEALLAAD